jgi:hypothetical protein
MILVQEGMATPTLEVVLEALQTCGAAEVHPRLLDALNLHVLGVLPAEFVAQLANRTASAHGAWIDCVLGYLL